MIMMKLAATTALLSGSFVPYLAQMTDPQSLKGLGPVALGTVIALAALSVVVYIVRSLVPAMNKSTQEMAKTNVLVSDLCNRLNTHLDEKAVQAKQEALSLIEAAKTTASSVVAEAAREAIRVVTDAHRVMAENKK
jgi:hypothetical protein